jgi:hypothetical protein
MRQLTHTFFGFAALAAVAVAAPAQALPVIEFDDVFIQGGTLSHAGGATPIVGTDVIFDQVQGIDTPLNASTFDCVGCRLNFETGDRTSFTPGVVSLYTFAGGGSFTLTGAVPAAGIGGGSTLLTGNFTGVSVAIASGFNVNFTGLGVDTKNPDLLAFFGITSDEFVFSNSTITGAAAGGIGADGAFTAAVQDGDLVNTAIPEPATLGLIGSGLVGIAVAMRRRRVAATS